MTPGEPPDGWERPAREHRAAVAAFVDTAARIPPAAWARPLAADGWTPAQVAEHVALTMEAWLAELAGGPPVRVRVGPVTERLLRWFLLPHLLFHRSIPVRARAARETRPGERGLDQAGVAPRLREAADRLERELRATPRDRLTHPYFGPIPLRPALRFVAVHTEHHRRQLERVASPRG